MSWYLFNGEYAIEKVQTYSRRILNACDKSFAYSRAIYIACDKALAYSRSIWYDISKVQVYSRQILNDTEMALGYSRMINEYLLARPFFEFRMPRRQKMLMGLEKNPHSGDIAIGEFWGPKG